MLESSECAPCRNCCYLIDAVPSRTVAGKIENIAPEATAGVELVEHAITREDHTARDAEPVADRCTRVAGAIVAAQLANQAAQRQVTPATREGEATGRIGPACDRMRRYRSCHEVGRRVLERDSQLTAIRHRQRQPDLRLANEDLPARPLVIDSVGDRVEI